MPMLNWEKFYSLPGSPNQNLETLCRALVRLHFEQYGQFAALRNQPGVEFHLKLTSSCTLGDPPRWYGWQCKLYKQIKSGDLTSASRKDIEDSLKKTEKHLPNITDWVLWTPYTLSKKDQEWLKTLHTALTLHQWTNEDLDTYLNGPGLFLRNTYFGDLVVTPEELRLRHEEAVQSIRKRWLDKVHQSVDAERIVRRMLGEPGSWDQLTDVGQRLKSAADNIFACVSETHTYLKTATDPLVSVCSTFADTLLHFHEILLAGDLDIIRQKLSEQKTLVNKHVRDVPRLLRKSNLPIAIDATNALDDMRTAQNLLKEVEEFLGVGVVAVLADAGGGKTQMSAQITAPQTDRPAGILLHGRNLHRGQTLNDLAHHFSINGVSLNSMENLLAALDAAGKRARCRLPVIIDGLNEAENPRDWKAPLASLGVTMKRYPNVLVVCTLRTGERRRDEQQWQPRLQTNNRESFAIMALPDEMRRVESEGYGEDVYEAVEKYFRFFKINPGDAEIPFDLFQHQLTLRIFCEVTNPRQESEVRVDYFQALLSPLFEKYVTNACIRISEMTNLKRSYSIDELRSVIFKLGVEMWTAQHREISENHFRNTVLDAPDWDSSVVNLFVQEGIIFRNPGDTPDDFLITPAHDALGGYLIAKSLLEKYQNDTTFEWLKKQDTIALFSSDNSHPLAVDIFKSLVSLTPRYFHGSNLWRKTSVFSDAALRFTVDIEPTYIDQDTTEALLKLLKDEPKRRNFLFSRIRRTRSAVNHPLNVNFLDSALKLMSINERDLSWTEWIRETRAEKFKDLLAMELRWKQDLSMRTPADQLRAKWIMWLLTSTDHELRDIATRALYWFGRGNPESLFAESLNSLNINDPYVPERMLAASYGVMMAKQVDLTNQAFVNTILPKYARNLYDSIFAKGASFSTTHLLMREYATRVIEVAVLHNPKLFNAEEIRRTQSPFLDGGIREWGENTTLKESHGGDSPFRMDFENYTIGSLVRERSNYDYKHEGYQEIRAKILWRIEQLGWSSNQFKNVDDSIASSQHWGRTSHDAKKIDRYGKKYSWIAFFEMSGFLNDKSILEDWRERTSSVDIDPSFPERVIKERFIKADFLGDQQMDTKEWIANGPLPDVGPCFRVAKVQSLKGPWVALDGFVVQEDKKRGRRIFCFIRSLIVANRDARSILNYLRKQNMGGRWLPEKPSVIYTFAGEIPWCETFPKNGACEMSFVTKEKKVKVLQSNPELYLDGKKLGLTQIELIQHRLFGTINEKEKISNDLSDEDIERVEVRESQVEVEEIKKEFKKFNVLIPVCDFGWEGYQTEASDAGHATTLAKEIAFDLELIGQPQTFDLFTKDGKRSTLNVSDQSGDYNNHQSMFFIREDLLKTYLKKNNSTMIWAVWGEREYSYDQLEKLRNDPNRPAQTYAVYSFIKKY
ncbi:MAG: hypothetical protein WC481_00420 [Candidatus Omnitrophota bacterium]